MVNEMGHRWTKLNASIKDCCQKLYIPLISIKQPKNLAMCDRPSLSMRQQTDRRRTTGDQKSSLELSAQMGLKKG